jgi:hydroxymethylbilane synthase
MRLSPETSNDTTVKKIRISARHSDLARLQAYRVGDALMKAHAGLSVEYNFRASLGDLNQSDPLWKMPEKGVFTDDFLRDLKEETADLVVHSWKDLPTEQRPDTEIVATLPRADVRDLLLYRKDRLGTADVRILTSSPRRAHNLGEFLKTHLPFEVNDLRFESVRGNIPTRLKKLLSQDVEGLIVAKAALDRLLEAPEPEFQDVQSVIRDVLSKCQLMVLPLTINPTAAAQGALAVEIKRGRPEIANLLKAIHCEKTFNTVEKERNILASYGGGCHQKIGVNVLSKPYGDLTFMRGLTDRGEVLDRVHLLPNIETQSAPNSSPEKQFPREGESSAFFEREALPRTTWATAEQAKFLWVARESAWPIDFVASRDGVVWCAGLKTWRKLAERGVWVTGSAEGLGEEEATGLEALLQQKDIRWMKLSHEGSANFNERAADEKFKLCATYRLKPLERAPNLAGRTHFYWASASAFDRALALFPTEVRAGFHACGPGLTYKHIRRVLGPAAPLHIELRH